MFKKWFDKIIMKAEKIPLPVGKNNKSNWFHER